MVISIEVKRIMLKITGLLVEIKNMLLIPLVII